MRTLDILIVALAPYAKATLMADANFWRDLANQFRAIQDPHGRLFAEWTFIQKIKEGPPGDAYWVVDGNDETRVRLEFEALARRGGRAIDTGGDD